MARAKYFWPKWGRAKCSEQASPSHPGITKSKVGVCRCRNSKKGSFWVGEPKIGWFFVRQLKISYHWPLQSSFYTPKLTYFTIRFSKCVKNSRKARRNFKFLFKFKMERFCVGYWNRDKTGCWICIRGHLTGTWRVSLGFYQCPAAGHFKGRRGPDLTRGPLFEKACSTRMLRIPLQIILWLNFCYQTLHSVWTKFGGWGCGPKQAPLRQMALTCLCTQTSMTVITQ